LLARLQLAGTCEQAKSERIGAGSSTYGTLHDLTSAEVDRDPPVPQPDLDD
jgi:hypothetical protein